MKKLRMNFYLNENEIKKVVKELSTINSLIGDISGIDKDFNKLDDFISKYNNLKLPISKILLEYFKTKQEKKFIKTTPTKRERPLVYEFIPDVKDISELNRKDGKYVVDYFNDVVSDKMYLVAEHYRQELKTSKATESEKHFKVILKSLGIKYEYQHVIFTDSYGHFFIVDFYLPDYNLAIEIDGGYHYDHPQYVKDKQRTKTLLKAIKLKAIRRFKNKDVILDESFMKKVQRVLEDVGLSRMSTSAFAKFLPDSTKKKRTYNKKR